MTTDWPYSAEQRAFQATLARAQTALPAPGAELSEEHWRAVAAAGALALTDPDTGADALDLVAAGEALGAGGCPGPWWQTLLVVPLLHGQDRERAVAGELLVTAGTGERMPWGDQAGRLFELGAYDERGWRVRPARLVSVQERWTSLGHEPVVAGVLETTGGEVLVAPRPALLARLGLAAYLAGAGRRALTDTARYAAQRTQFRTRIGDFGAIAHPLAECDAGVRAATVMARRAAALLDESPDGPEASGAVHLALRAAARAGRQTVYQAHQTYGAIGFTDEGPLAWLGERVALLATEAERLARDVALVTP